jgi:phosphatidylinositol alpha-1,6-mannosyltransferase
VQFVGLARPDELPAYFASADVFVHPNRVEGEDFEGFGIVFLEAAACGVPQVAGHSGGSDEAVVDGVTGRVVHGDDPIAVAAALAPLVDDPDVRTRMGRAARDRAVAEFDYDKLAVRLADALTTR